MILETIPQLALLNREDKSCLAFELWDAAEGDERPLTPQQEALLERRLADYHSNPENVLTAEQVTENLRKLKERIKHSKQ